MKRLTINHLKEYLFFLFILIACSRHEKKGNQPEYSLSDSISAEIQKLTVLIDKDRTNGSLFAERGKLFIHKQDLENALTDLKVALKIDNGKSEFYYTLANVYTLKGEAENARKALQNCIKIDPLNSDALLRLAEICMVFMEYDVAAEHIMRSIKINKRNPHAYFLSALLFKSSGDTARTLASLQTTVEQDPEHFQAYYELGILNLALKNEIAIEYLNNALRLKPENTDALYAKGMYYQQTGKMDEAKKVYSSLIDLQPGFSYAHYNLGYIEHEYFKNSEVALEHFKNALKADSNYANACYMMGLCKEETADYKGAIADYKKTLSLELNHELAIDGLNRINP